MTPTTAPPSPSARSDSTALWVAVGFAGLSLACVVARTWMAAPQAVYVLAAFFALGAYAFLTRWIQRTDRTGSRLLQFLERLRCYLAHEDPSGPGGRR